MPSKLEELIKESKTYEIKILGYLINFGLFPYRLDKPPLDKAFLLHYSSNKVMKINQKGYIALGGLLEMIRS